MVDFTRRRFFTALSAVAVGAAVGLPSIPKTIAALTPQIGPYVPGPLSAHGDSFSQFFPLTFDGMKSIRPLPGNVLLSDPISMHHFTRFTDGLPAKSGSLQLVFKAPDNFDDVLSVVASADGRAKVQATRADGSAGITGYRLWPRNAHT